MAAPQRQDRSQLPGCFRRVSLGETLRASDCLLELHGINERWLDVEPVSAALADDNLP